MTNDAVSGMIIKVETETSKEVRKSLEELKSPPKWNLKLGSFWKLWDNLSDVSAHTLSE